MRYAAIESLVPVALYNATAMVGANADPITCDSVYPMETAL